MSLKKASTALTEVSRVYGILGLRLHQVIDHKLTADEFLKQFETGRIEIDKQLDIFKVEIQKPY